MTDPKPALSTSGQEIAQPECANCRILRQDLEHEVRVSATWKDLCEKARAHSPAVQAPQPFPDFFSLEVELEDDGRWLAEVNEVPGAMAYGDQPSDAILGALAIARIEGAVQALESQPQDLGLKIDIQRS